MTGSITSGLLDEAYRLIYESHGRYLKRNNWIIEDGVEPDPEECPSEETETFNLLLYRSDHHYILLMNQTETDFEEDLYDPDELVKECFYEPDEPDLYLREEYYAALEELCSKPGSILKIYQFEDDTVNFCFIENRLFYEKIISIDDPIRTAQMINDYISEAEQTDEGAWICSRIETGKLRKYTI